MESGKTLKVKTSTVADEYIDLLEDLASRDSEFREEYLRNVNSVDPTLARLSALVCLSDSASAVRAEAVELLDRSGSKRGDYGRIVRMLNDEDDFVRLAAVEWLGNHAPRKGFRRLLVAAKHDPNDLVQKFAWLSIVQSAIEDPALRNLVESEAEEFLRADKPTIFAKSWLLFALTDLDPKYVSRLEELDESTPLEVADTPVTMLGRLEIAKIAAESSFEDLEQLLKTVYGEVREWSSPEDKSFFRLLGKRDHLESLVK